MNDAKKSHSFGASNHGFQELIPIAAICAFGAAWTSGNLAALRLLMVTLTALLLLHKRISGPRFEKAFPRGPSGQDIVVAAEGGWTASRSRFKNYCRLIDKKKRSACDIF